MLSHLLLTAVLLSFSLPAAAGALYMKHGQSRNFHFTGDLDTIFISDPRVADYKVVNNKNIIVYAKNTGTTDLIVYGRNNTVLLKHSISVDPFLSDINQRVARLFPGNSIEVTRFMGGATAADKVVYIINGSVTDEESMDAIYQLVGSIVNSSGGEEKDNKSANKRVVDSKINTDLIEKKKYANVINKMQLVASNQVNVHLTVVEVSKTFTDALGIDWSSLTLSSIVNGGASINNPGTFNLLGFKGGFDAKNISTVINAIQNDSVARIMAQPNLTVLSGETADFLVGGEIPILSKNSDNEGTTVTYKEYGIKLSIAAKVEKKSKIKLSLSNEISSISGAYSFNAYSIPTLTTRRSSSTIELADGDSFAIGGLLTEKDYETLGKVPFIGDIPILGALARNSNTQREKTELVIFATVNLVKPVASNRDIVLPEYNKTSNNKLFFNVGVDKGTRENRLSKDTDKFLSYGGFSQ
ncbi:pilus assembly protein N-terminal domain-containing protein [Citrobacter rodentium NBRC 105723 = DSM 16636]|nr:tight adherence secretin RcpA [Citrobacter rodentium]UHO33403.1 pilus assembly protein N-terminal domain-containing protein [Citrobacter rodentium NBRC 105723 = DSM 16636]HAT8012627.1 tight adherence secretin RcpA [Citrobacter rodentium NBRC 105723 = DSM 16636]HAT8017927.1 tight adherence secretin RcpA [Citrobacter rodentium]HAT8027465.1 tight adherence secretin RcpA [Citrobacter rodentium]